MAELLAEAAEEAAEGINKIAVEAIAEVVVDESTKSMTVGGKISFTITSISVPTVKGVCIAAGVTAVTLGAMYAGYRFIAKAIDGAVTRGVGGERDDQARRMLNLVAYTSYCTVLRIRDFWKCWKIFKVEE